MGGVVYSACTVVEPGVVSVANRRNRLVALVKVRARQVGLY